MSKQILCMIMLVISYSVGPFAQVKEESKTLIEEAMDISNFKSCGLQKLTKEELRNLDKWLKNALDIVYQKGKSEAKVIMPVQPQLKKMGDLEEAIIVKDFDGDKVIIERANGEKWILEAKTWCSWSWRYEGRKVLLKFGYVSSKLINDDGDDCEFWTEEEID